MRNRKGYSAYSGISHVRAAQVDTLWKPGDQVANHGVVLCHGAGAAYNFVEYTRTGSLGLGPALTTEGFPCISAEMSGDSFANDASMTDMTNAAAYLSAQTGIPTDKYHLVGASMGAGVALRWAYLNQSKVASIVGIIPMTSIINIYTANTAGLQSSIATAWGVTAPAALPSGADLLAQASSLKAAGIPIRFYIAGSDTTVSASDVNAHAAASGAEVVGPVGSAGHTETSIANIGAYNGAGWADLLSFLVAHDA